MKTCTKCGLSLALEFFNKKTKGKLQPWCRECQKVVKTEHYNKNKSVYVKKAGERVKSNRKWLDSLKENKPCLDCGLIYPSYVMDFDHKREKEFTISEAIRRHSRERILKEIEKCDLVCANCHRIRTYAPVV